MFVNTEKFHNKIFLMRDKTFFLFPHKFYRRCLRVLSQWQMFWMVGKVVLTSRFITLVGKLCKTLNQYSVKGRISHIFIDIITLFVYNPRVVLNNFSLLCFVSLHAVKVALLIQFTLLCRQWMHKQKLRKLFNFDLLNENFSWLLKLRWCL